MSFYTFFDCKRSGCDTVGDLLAIKIKDTGDYDEVYKTGTDYGRYNDVQWQKHDIEITLTGPQVYVIIIFILFRQHHFFQQCVDC
jgi:sigma54-dependent transcription regulator